VLAKRCKRVRLAIAKRKTMRIERRTPGQVFAHIPTEQRMKRGATTDAESVRVCIFCGSPRPEELLPQCAHGIVATVRGNERRVAARLFVAFQAVHAQRAAMVTTLDLAVAKGTATVDHAPEFESAGNNVIPMHDRGVLLARSKS
jgi:hypothetical protein